MLIAIHQDNCGSSSDRWIKALFRRGIDVQILDLTASDALVRIQDYDGVFFPWEDAKKPMIQGIMIIIEDYLRIPVWPSYHEIWHLDDKISQFYLLQKAAAPMPKTWVFWDKQKAMKWALQTEYPKVIKLSPGSDNFGVSIVHTSKEASHFIERMFGSGIVIGQGAFKRGWPTFTELARRSRLASQYIFQGQQPRLIEKGYAYFQEFVPDNDYRLEIDMIGDRAFAITRLNGANDFRSTGPHVYNPSNVDLRCVQIAFEISDHLGFQSMTYDFLSNHGKPVVLELSRRRADKVANCPGFWTRDLEWISGQICPEEAEVEAFLKITTKKIKGNGH